MLHWSNKYLSVPYKNMNCSKFVEYVLKDHFGIIFNFPQTEGTLFAQSELIKEAIPVFSSYPEKANDPEDGDLVLMHGLRRMCHVGMYVKIKNISYVLHSESKIGSSCLHRFDDLKYYGMKLEGVYKWLK